MGWWSEVLDFKPEIQQAKQIFSPKGQVSVPSSPTISSVPKPTVTSPPLVITAPPLVKDAEKKIDPTFEREAKNFISSAPNILFIIDYVVENQFVGVLVVWEEYRDATHYEVYKKNVFDADGEFERVLFLDKQNLIKERENFLDYIKNTVGFSNLDSSKIFVFLDDVVKLDRIYEYKVSAARVPVSAIQIDFDLIMEVKEKVTRYDIGALTKLSNVSKLFFNDERAAWMISLMNEEIPFFGTMSLTTPPIKNYTSATDILIPTDKTFLQNLINESVYMFGAANTFSNLIDSIGGANDIYKREFLNSIVSDGNNFSPTIFRSKIKASVPVFGLLSNLFNSKYVGQVSLIVPSFTSDNIATANINLNTIDGITSAFDFMNKAIFSVLIAQDPKIFETLSIVNESSNTPSETFKNINLLNDLIATLNPASKLTALNSQLIDNNSVAQIVQQNSNFSQNNLTQIDKQPLTVSQVSNILGGGKK